MKLKNIFTAIASICAIAIGCTKSYPTHLENIQVSQSTIGLDSDAQRELSVDVSANLPWTMETEIPAWLSVSPLQGSAGTTVVKFKAAAVSKACNKVTLKIKCGDQTQYIYVQQGKGAAINTPETAFSPEEAIDFFEKGNKGAEVYVKGVVKSATISTSYGNANFFLETNSTKYGDFEFYRCKDLDNEKFTDDKKVQPGDIVIGFGTLTAYGSTVELGEGCYLVGITKSLVKLLDNSKIAVEKEDTLVPVRVVKSGDNLDVTSDASWINVNSIKTLKGKTDPSLGTSDPDTTVINLHIAQNLEAARKGSVSLSSSSDGQSSTISVSVSQKSGIAAVELPYAETFADQY